MDREIIEGQTVEFSCHESDYSSNWVVFINNTPIRQPHGTLFLFNTKNIARAAAKAVIAYEPVKRIRRKR